MLEMVVLASFGVELGIRAISIVVGGCKLMGVKEVDQRAWCCIQMVEFLRLDDIVGYELMVLLMLISLGSCRISRRCYALCPVKSWMIEWEAEAHLV